jgi:hypothetical protein
LPEVLSVGQTFFFQLDDGQVPHEREAADLADVAEARCHAVQLIAETLCDQPQRFWERETYSVTVSDPDGLILFMVQMVATFSAAGAAKA